MSDDTTEMLLCTVCSLPIPSDRYTEDDGNPIHERCYLRKIAPTMNEETVNSVARMMRSGCNLVSFKV